MLIKQHSEDESSPSYREAREAARGDDDGLFVEKETLLWMLLLPCS